jgi:hypothetical protein
MAASSRATQDEYVSSAATTKTSIAILLGVVALLLVSVRPGMASGGFDQTSGVDVVVKVVDRGTLVPGRAAPLRVRLTNPYPYAITVSTIRTELQAAVRGCSASAATNAAGVRLAARGSATASVSVTLAAAAQNRCQGALFAATFSVDAARS